jgi:hypothetical protein
MSFRTVSGSVDQFAYIGLFDGYHGSAASSLCRQHFQDAILWEMAKFSPNAKVSDTDEALINQLYRRMIDPFDQTHDKVADAASAYRLAYSKMDYLLSRGLGESSNVRWSGTSALTAVIAAHDHLDAFLNGSTALDEKIALGQIHIANCGKDIPSKVDRWMSSKQVNRSRQCRSPWHPPRARISHVTEAYVIQ